MTCTQSIGRPRRKRKKRVPVFPPAEILHRRKIMPDPCVFDAGRWQRMTLLAGTMIATMRAVERAAQQREVMARAARVGAPEVWTSSSDRGAQGPAMQARGAKVEDVLVDVIEHAGGTHLDRASVARVRDGTIDHYERIGVLWGRRLEAVQEMARLYQAGRVAPGTGRSSGCCGGGDRGYGQMSTRQARAWADYCRASDHLSPSVRPVIEDVARDRFPADIDAVVKLRDGAMALADYFRLYPDKVPQRG